MSTEFDRLIEELHDVEARLASLTEYQGIIKAKLFGLMGDLTSYTAANGAKLTKRNPSRRMNKDGEQAFLKMHPEAVKTKEVFDTAAAKKLDPALYESLRQPVGEGTVVLSWPESEANDILKGRREPSDHLITKFAKQLLVPEAAIASMRTEVEAA